MPDFKIRAVTWETRDGVKTIARIREFSIERTKKGALTSDSNKRLWWLLAEVEEDGLEVQLIPIKKGKDSK